MVPLRCPESLQLGGRSEVTLCPTAFEGIIPSILRFTWWPLGELKPLLALIWIQSSSGRETPRNDSRIGDDLDVCSVVHEAVTDS